MKIKTINLIFGIFLLAIPYKADPESINKTYKHKIKEITELHYVVQMDENKIENEILTSKFKFLFDEKGNITREIQYNSKGNIWSETSRSFNVKNQIVKQIEIFPLDKSEGKKIYDFKYFNDGYEIYINGIFSGKDLQRFDEDKNLVENIKFNSKKEKWLNIFFEYRGDGTLQKSVIHDLKTNGKNIKEYDSRGNIVSESINYNNKIKKTFLYDKFDEYENWVLKVIYLNNKKSEVIKRELKYYQ